MIDFANARKNMVDGQVHTAGVTDPGILNAFRTVPRETFVPQNLQKIAYADEELPLGGGRYLPAPISHARMLQAAAPEKGDKVLDIGGGTGYAAAIVAPLVSKVAALEEEEQFLEYASAVWAHLGHRNIMPIVGLLNVGFDGEAPFDIIFIHGAVTEIPARLAGQLAPGGRLVAIVRKPGAVMGQATLLVNSAGNKFSSRVLFDAGAHYLPAFAPKAEFVFNN